MSTQIADAAPAALAATTHDIAGSGQLAVAIALLAIGVSVAWRVGTFHRHTVLGPDRVAHDTPVAGFWFTVMTGLAVWMLVPAIYISVAHPQSTDRDSALTQDSDAVDEPKLSPRERVTLGGSSQLLACGALLLAGAGLFPRGLSLLGLFGPAPGLQRRSVAEFESASTHKFAPALPSKNALARAVVGALIALPLTFGASLLAQWIWTALDFATPSDHELIRVLRADPSIVLRAVVAITAVLIAPVFEELFFRGCFQTALLASFRAASTPRANSAPGFGINPTSLIPVAPMASSSVSEAVWPRWIAIVVTSLLFALVHEAGAGSRWMLPPLFLFSLCLGYAYERTGDLRIPVFMHASFNGVSLALAFVG